MAVISEMNGIFYVDTFEITFNFRYLHNTIARTDYWLHHVCPFICPFNVEQSCSHPTDFRKILYFFIFTKIDRHNPILVKIGLK